MGTETTFVYAARLVAEDGGFVITFRDVPEAITEGEDREDALGCAADALRSAVEIYLDEGRAVPAPTRARRGEVLVPLDPVLALKAALSEALAASGLSKSALARALGADQKEVRRLLDPRHASKARRLGEALRILGRSVAVQVSARRGYM